MLLYFPVTYISPLVQLFWFVLMVIFLIPLNRFFPTERPGAQWPEGSACVLRNYHGDQPVLHHVYRSTE